jgi:hypothetical protein
MRTGTGALATFAARAAIKDKATVAVTRIKIMVSLSSIQKVLLAWLNDLNFRRQ